MPTTDTVTGGVLGLVLSAGPAAKAILLILVLFSVVSWALIIDKWWQFRRVRRQTLAFLKAFREARRASAIQAAAKKLRESPLAQLYAAVYQEVTRLPEGGEPVGVDELDEGLGAGTTEIAERALRRTAALEVARLERYLPFLATTASTTPFIGLFGTVWGIMYAFHGIGQQGSASLAVVAPGISEALIATAAGLGAAIPAVIAYNLFVSRVRHWATEMEGFTLDLLNLLSRPAAKARVVRDGV